jgi:hypothetical protein
VKLPGKNAQISVTNDNVVSLSLLAKEFCFDELSSECSTLLSTLDPLGTLESIRIISRRISELEGRLSSPPVFREIDEGDTEFDALISDKVSPTSLPWRIQFDRCCGSLCDRIELNDKCS